MLLMGPRDLSTPQDIYPEMELLSHCRWRQCQALAEQFWIHFIQYYLPPLQNRTSKEITLLLVQSSNRDGLPRSK